MPHLEIGITRHRCAVAAAPVGKVCLVDIKSLSENHIPSPLEVVRLGLSQHDKETPTSRAQIRCRRRRVWSGRRTPKDAGKLPDPHGRK